MLNPIQLTPNMDMSTLTNAVNDMMRQIESTNRTQVVKDENGKNRIIIGRLPDGTYGVVISKVGEDVLAVLQG